MYCSRCGRELPGGAAFCAACGTPRTPLASRSAEYTAAGVQAGRRPVAGIVVAGVLGSVGLLWSCVAVLSFMSGPTGVQGLLFRAFPGLQDIQFLTTSAGMVGNAAVLIGAVMSFLLHPAAAKVVRVSSWAMLLTIGVSTVVTGAVIFGSAAWPSLEAPARGSLMGGLVGGAIGGLIQWGLILFLFRKSRWP
jgi:zinc-ribbon domain